MAKKRGRKQLWSDELLQQVADAYIAACKARTEGIYTPVKGVAEACGVTWYRARNLVRIARDRGFLPSTTAGRPTPDGYRHLYTSFRPKERLCQTKRDYTPLCPDCLAIIDATRHVKP